MIFLFVIMSLIDSAKHKPAGNVLARVHCQLIGRNFIYIAQSRDFQSVRFGFPYLPEFPEIEASILAIRLETGFTDFVDQPEQNCGFVLDKTIFYAESGGQQADHGFITSLTNEVRVQSSKLHHTAQTLVWRRFLYS